MMRSPDHQLPSLLQEDLRTASIAAQNSKAPEKTTELCNVALAEIQQRHDTVCANRVRSV
ncbi:MAG: hypothetical protein CSA58_07395 [Micrococcales bacterium]|nr:MAG: hypothetical protein CSA58_07395 [Micrococcales bacterium]